MLVIYIPLHNKHGLKVLRIKFHGVLSYLAVYGAWLQIEWLDLNINTVDHFMDGKRAQNTSSNLILKILRLYRSQ